MALLTTICWALIFVLRIIFIPVLFWKFWCTSIFRMSILSNDGHVCDWQQLCDIANNDDDVKAIPQQIPQNIALLMSHQDP